MTALISCLCSYLKEINSRKYHLIKREEIICTCCKKFFPRFCIFVENVTGDREVHDILRDVTTIDLHEIASDDHTTVTSDTVLLPDSIYKSQEIIDVVSISSTSDCLQCHHVG